MRFPRCPNPHRRLAVTRGSGALHFRTKEERLALWIVENKPHMFYIYSSSHSLGIVFFVWTRQQMWTKTFFGQHLPIFFSEQSSRAKNQFVLYFFDAHQSFGSIAGWTSSYCAKIHLLSPLCHRGKRGIPHLYALYGLWHVFTWIYLVRASGETAFT